MFRARGLDLDTPQMSTDRERKRLYKQSGIYVRPCQKILPNGSKAYYIQRRPLLQNLFRRPEVASYFLQPFSYSDDSFLRDFSDGIRFRSHTVLKEKENAVGCTTVLRQRGTC